MKSIKVCCVLLALACLPCALSAQRHAETVLSEYQTVKLAEGVYAFVAPESKTPFVSGNSMVVIGKDGALVVDSTNVPSLARRMIAEIKRLTGKPVRFLVNTHWHPDHLMGNAAYQEAFPNIRIVSATGMREIADVQVPAYFAQTLGPGSATMTNALRTMLESGKKRNGTELTADEREFFELELADYEAWSAEAKGARYVAPTVTFDREMIVGLGGRDVRLTFLGRANTAGDTVVYVPDARIVATGDLLVGPTPYATASFLREWVGVFDQLARIDVAAVVPGHGPVEHDWRHATLVRTLLQSVIEQVDRAVAKGFSLDDTRKAVDVAAIRDQMTAGDPFRRRAFDDFFLTSAIERTYRDAMYRAEK
jgi:glyoxylase-like metal-dependent hydrolase (beta-lactamase superfamily II)